MKLSHSICGSERNIKSPYYYDMPETGRVPIGCINPPHFGHKFCLECLETYQTLQDEPRLSSPSGTGRKRSSAASFLGADKVKVIQRIHGHRTAVEQGNILVNMLLTITVYCTVKNIVENIYLHLFNCQVL